MNTLSHLCSACGLLVNLCINLCPLEEEEEEEMVKKEEVEEEEEEEEEEQKLGSSSFSLWLGLRASLICS